MKKMEKGHLQPLRERHNMMHNKKAMKIEVGDVVLIKGEGKNKRKKVEHRNSGRIVHG